MQQNPIKFYLNPDLFFLLDKGAVQVWNYGAHQQYEIDPQTFAILAYISCDATVAFDQNILNDLHAAGLIDETPYKSVAWGWDLLSKMFHKGTQNIGDRTPVSAQDWVVASLEYNLSVKLEQDDLSWSMQGPKIPLCPDIEVLQNQSLLTTLLNRKTVRQFSGNPVSLQTLSTLLYVCFGTVHQPSDTSSCFIGRRKTSPSTGGLHPTEAFVLVFKGKDIDPGLYHYDVSSNALTRLKDVISHEQLTALFYGQPYVQDCAVGIFLVSRLYLIWKKYPHSRSYRDALLDVGHVSQTTLLTATALGLSTWMSGLFDDEKVSELLKIDGLHAAPFLFLALGDGL